MGDEPKLFRGHLDASDAGVVLEELCGDALFEATGAAARGAARADQALVAVLDGQDWGDYNWIHDDHFRLAGGPVVDLVGGDHGVDRVLELAQKGAGLHSHDEED